MLRWYRWCCVVMFRLVDLVLIVGRCCWTVVCRLRLCVRLSMCGLMLRFRRVGRMLNLMFGGTVLMLCVSHWTRLLTLNFFGMGPFFLFRWLVLVVL